MLPEPPESIPPESPVLLETSPETAESAHESGPNITRGRAAAEVLLCSGYPTQLVIIAMLGAVGIQPIEGGTLSPTFMFAVSVIDTFLLLGLVFFFLHLSRERPKDVFAREGSFSRELQVGVLLLPAIFLLVIVVQLAIQQLAPYLHNVDVSPFTSLLTSPVLALGFAALVMIAGGVREELQRAFLLHRFEQRLGGGRLGILLTSVAFGLGHTLQGWDAAIITALMGAFWGAIYVTRRNVVSTVTNHALFNLTQVALGYVTLPTA